MAKGRSVCGRVLLCLSMAFLVASISATRLWAQAQTATISGTATDASGAAMVDAKIQATNTETNASQSTVSDSQGRYTIPDLPVGTYSVQASQSGFQTVVHTGVTLSVGGAVVVNFSMPVGEVTQTVSVESQVSRVETTTSEVSTLVSPQQMRELPLNGRNFEQLLTLAPGVSTIPPALNFVTGRLYGMMDNYSISGMRPTGQMFLLDGTDIRDFWEHATGSGYGGTSLGVEAIGQFQVLTNSYTSQYAGNGAVINAVSRAGTNDLHGGAYEFIRNSAFDARDIADVFGGRTSPPPFKRNQFGAAIGGPIKKDKLFFFGNYEGLRNSQATTIGGLGAAEPYLAAGMLPCYDIYGNAANTAPVGTCPARPATSQAAGGDTPVPVGDASVDPILPVGGANTQAQEIASLYSLRKGTRPYAETTTFGPGGGTTQTLIEPVGTDYGGYSYVTSSPTLVNNENYVLGRVDYTIGSSDSVFGRYVLDHANVLNGSQDLFSIFPETDYTRNQYLTVAENHIISPTMINVLRFGFVRTNESMYTELGLSAAQISAASTFSSANGGPTFSTDPLDFVRTAYSEPAREDGSIAVPGTYPLGPDPNRPNIFMNKFSGGDDLSWTHGSHTLKIGGVITRAQFNARQESYAAGEDYIVFVNFFSPNNAEAPFLQGSPFLGFADPPGLANANRYFREIDIAPYFQDDWKVTSRLTLNLGIRLDYATNPVGWSGGNQPLTVLTGSFLPPTGPLAPVPTCAANALTPGGSEYGNTLAMATCGLQYYSPVKHAFASNPNSHNWEPRFGFAYSPFKDNKTAIRGGFGVFDDPTAARIYQSGFGASPPASNFLLYFPSFPDAFNPTSTCLAAFGFCPGPSEYAGVTYQDNWGSPYTMQYNFDIQRQITPGTILTGKLRWFPGPSPVEPARHQPFAVHHVPELHRAAASPEVISYRFGRHLYGQSEPLPRSQREHERIRSRHFRPSPSPQPTCYGSGVRFPFVLGGGGAVTVNRLNPVFGEMITEAPTASSSYSSLQVGLNHQFSRSLSFQVNYTYSHCIDDGSFATSLEEFSQLQTDSYNQAYDYENCNFDVRHNLNVNGIYALPFKGNRLVSGWQFTTILSVHSGLPINITTGSPYDPADLGSEWDSRPNYSYAPGCHPNHILIRYTDSGRNSVVQSLLLRTAGARFLGER